MEFHNTNDYERFEKIRDESAEMSSFNDKIATYPVNNIDEFFSNIYIYYHSKGYKNIILKGITDFTSLVFTLILSIFFYYIDWSEIRQCDLKNFSCNDISIFNSNIEHYILSKIIFIFYCIIFSIYLLWYFVSNIFFYYKMYKIKCFYLYSLDITDNLLLFINFNDVLDKLLELQDRLHFTCGRRIYNKQDKIKILNRINRKDNLLIALISNDVISSDLSYFFKPLFYSKTMEWNLRLIFINELNSSINKKILYNWEVLSKRFYLFGILSIILLPFTIMFNILNFMLDNVVHFHTEPKDFMNSTWNNYGYYYFRYYNELPHTVNQRLYLALNEAVSFNSNFKKIEHDTVQRFLIFIIGSITSFIIFLGFYNEAILNITFLERNLWWYIAVFTAIITILKNNLINQNFNQNPELYLKNMCEILGNKINNDIKNLDLYNTSVYLSRFLKYKFYNLVFEVISIFLTPFFLIYYSKNHIRHLSYWLKENLEKDDDLGYIYKNINMDEKSDLVKQSLHNFNKYYHN